MNVINIAGIMKDQNMTYKEYKDYRRFFEVEKCPICGKYTFSNGYICRVCLWESDGVLEDDDEYSYANYCSINEYRRKYQEKMNKG